MRKTKPMTMPMPGSCCRFCFLVLTAGSSDVRNKNQGHHWHFADAPPVRLQDQLYKEVRGHLQSNTPPKHVILERSNIFKRPKSLGRPKMFMDVQKGFGHPKKLWTARSTTQLTAQEPMHLFSFLLIMQRINRSSSRSRLTIFRRTLRVS